MFALLLLIAAFAALALHARRSRILFELSVRDGRVQDVRGRIPPGLLEALEDVMQRARVEKATLRAVRSDGRAQLESSGLNELAEQRARNVLGTFPLQKLLSAKVVAKRRR